MADSVASGFGEEKETENNDKEKEKPAANSKLRPEKHRSTLEVTETLGFYERNTGKRDKQRNLSGE